MVSGIPAYATIARAPKTDGLSLNERISPGVRHDEGLARGDRVLAERVRQGGLPSDASGSGRPTLLLKN